MRAETEPPPAKSRIQRPIACASQGSSLAGIEARTDARGPKRLRPKEATSSAIPSLAGLHESALRQASRAHGRRGAERTASASRPLLAFLNPGSVDSGDLNRALDGLWIEASPSGSPILGSRPTTAEQDRGPLIVRGLRPGRRLLIPVDVAQDLHLEERLVAHLLLLGTHGQANQLRQALLELFAQGRQSYGLLAG